MFYFTIILFKIGTISVDRFQDRAQPIFDRWIIEASGTI
jgi:hypothetical protein